MEEVVVGRVAKPHGLKGEVAVEVHTDEPESRFTAGRVFRTDRGELTVESVRFHKGRPMLRFAEVPGRNEAEELRGLYLRMDIDPDEVTGEDEFHDVDLLGLTVVHEGEAVGEVQRVDHGPAYETLVVKRRGTHPALIPFVEAMIVDIDLDEETLTVDLPEGLLDLLCASTSSPSSRSTSPPSNSPSSAAPGSGACSRSTPTTSASGRTTSTTPSTARPPAAAPAW